jgi:hypothetical protein
MGGAVSLGVGSGKTMSMRQKGLSYQLLQQHLQVTDKATLRSVTTLLLCRNKLSSLPPELTHLVSLTELAATDNWLKKIPLEFMQMTTLRTLRLGGNRLAGFEELIPAYREGFVPPDKNAKGTKPGSAGAQKPGGAAATTGGVVATRNSPGGGKQGEEEEAKVVAADDEGFDRLKARRPFRAPPHAIPPCRLQLIRSGAANAGHLACIERRELFLTKMARRWGGCRRCACCAWGITA